MRIVQVVHAYPPEIGGIENHVYYLSKELVKLGHEVVVITSNPGGFPKEQHEDGVVVKRISPFKLPGFSSVRLSPTLILEILGTNADVYCSHGYGSLHPLITSIAATIKRKPFVFTVHGYPRLEGGERIFQFLYKHLIARFFLPNAKQIISVSKPTLEDIKNEIDPRKATVIPDGVDTDQFKRDGTEGKKVRKDLAASKVVSYVGRLDKYKGVTTLVKAFAKVNKEIPDSALMLVGKDEGMKQTLKRLALELGVSNRIHFKESTYATMSDVYSASDLVVLPSYYEGLSIALLEALSCETLFLATAVGGPKEILKGAYGKQSKDFLAPSKDDDVLAKKIINILENERKYSVLKKEGRRYVKKHYSWPRIASETVQIYEMAIGRD